MTLLCADLFHTFSKKPEHVWIPYMRRAPKFLIDDSHFDTIDSFTADAGAARDTVMEAMAVGRNVQLPFPDLVIEWRLPAKLRLPELGTVAGLGAVVIYVLGPMVGKQVEVVVYSLLHRRGQKRPEWSRIHEPSVWAAGVAKLLALLEADQTVRERVLAANLKRNWGGSPRTKPYDYTVLRAPVEYVGAAAEGTRGPGTPRRMHLVRGFQWGRHTRPIEEQRWIKPHWRGDESVGVVRRDHYRVAGDRK
jgi:hypothetical protein